MKKTFHIVGAGKVGQTLAQLLHRQGARLVAVSGGRDAAVLADRCGGVFVPHIAALPPAEMILITPPDNVIAEVAAELAVLPWLSGETLAVHCSGAKSVAVLASLAARGVRTGSLHPVFAFADVQAAVAALPGQLCALEAEPAAMDDLREIAAALGLRAFTLPSASKARYHAALSAASNFSVVLAAFAQQLLQPLALPEALSRELVSALMRQSVDNLAALTPAQALTGPIVRGDDSTVAAHLAALDAAERAQYCTWALAALALAAGRVDEAAAERLAALLEAV
ncbi:DUF2520 domain-containing protein [Uruburuella testudinis]|uniref:DUF2520 domain-containing protein n=1 Tax=Uruburuella testudinis TaxID=1282863 RepID=A0ABY4DZK2_9NEIS|nr:Rossmann-like and DUF2520 domain-containing protein [Uruburuella testudinis]UOO82131.1 DUF2520 domain-containing protein [Uruburuella testudinis]